MKYLISIIALLLSSTQTFAGPQPSHILLLPPTLINATGSEWVGDSVQQSLQADLHHAFIAHAAAPAPDDTSAMARLAKNASVDYLVQAHIQIAGDQVRLTASLYNNAGAAIGTAKATGDLRHLFDLEDALADQIHDALGKANAKRTASTPVPVVMSSGPLRVAAAQVLPVGTVPVAYSSEAIRDGRDRYLYQVPCYGCFGGCFGGGFGECGYGSCGYGFGGFGLAGRFGGVFNGGYSTGGTHSLAW